MNLTYLDQITNTKALAYIGFILVISKLYKLSKLFLNLFIVGNYNKNLSLYNNNTKFKYYALVSGCTDGIGLEYTQQLASKYYNVVLLSRSEDKLQALSEELKIKYPNGDFPYYVLDCKNVDSEQQEKLSNFIKGFPLSVLINNVGLSHAMPVPFLETPQDEWRSIIDINCTGTLAITQAVLPTLKKTVTSDPKLRGLILTMGSFGGLLPTPLLATYSGSKSFLQNWSNAMNRELLKYKIDTNLVLSYLVTSKMSKIRKSSFMIPNPKMFVHSVFKNLNNRGGAIAKYATCTPYWSHAIYHFIIEEFFGCYNSMVNLINFKFHLSIRQRALKKKAKQV
jgi:17beta-estradiol 17-dehydrogenase / very-long-chain 3-oxoacyl-CoA reductase